MELEQLAKNLCIILVKDWIKPLTEQMNKDYNLDLTEEYIISKINKKHMVKPKRLAKQNSNMIFKSRSFPNTMELVKISNHDRLYLMGESLVVYVMAPSSNEALEEEEEEEEEEHIEDEYADECETLQHSKMVSGVENPPKSENDCNGGIPNPEECHGYSFRGSVLAIGSLVNGYVTYLTDSDADKCQELCIVMDMAGKLRRAHQNMSNSRPYETDSDDAEGQHAPRGLSGDSGPYSAECSKRTLEERQLDESCHDSTKREVECAVPSSKMSKLC